jgi:hypothetical protein
MRCCCRVLQPASKIDADIEDREPHYTHSSSTRSNGHLIRARPGVARIGEAAEIEAAKRAITRPTAGVSLCDEGRRDAADMLSYPSGSIPRQALAITMPKITLEGDANGAPHPAPDHCCTSLGMMILSSAAWGEHNEVRWAMSGGPECRAFC